MVVEHPCTTCRGSGVVRKPRSVRVRVPAGVADGQRIRLKQRGAAGRNGGPPGDLYVVVHVAAHPLFGRRGNDLTISVPVTFAEAALGAEVKVPTLADPVTVKVPAGTRAGKVLRVRGRGVTTAKGAGDLLVTVDISVPQKLSAAERKAIEALATASAESPRAHLGV
jgi:molecular chaperone DnaJ